MDVTAFLSSSSTLGIVAGAFSVPENSSVTVVAPAALGSDQLAWSTALDTLATDAGSRAALASAGTGVAPATSPDPLIGPQKATARVAFAQLPSLRGVELLDQLALLDRTQLGRFVAQHPGSISQLIAHPPAASATATSWASLSRAQQLVMIRTAPRLIGSLEGVAYADRDRANRSVLATSETRIRSRIAGDSVGRAAKDELSKRLHMLEQVQAALKVGSSGNARSLIELDASGEGRAVIAIGDPSTADYVDYLIPGMFSDVDTQIQVLAGGADSISTQQKAWLARLNPGVPASQLPTVATLAWIGYQTPNIVNVASMDLAREGQKSLTASIEGLRAERAQRIASAEAVTGASTSATSTGTGASTTTGGTVATSVAQPYVAILAHSYGTTAAMLSLQDDGIHVDALAIVGSPGSPARTASDLNVTDGNVWVGAGDTDPVPQTGLFGSQPTSAAYGAHRFGVDGAVDPVTGHDMTSVVGHDGYFQDGTESLRNMVLIGIGRGDLVLGLDGQAALVLGKSHGTVPSGPQL